MAEKNEVLKHRLGAMNMKYGELAKAAQVSEATITQIIRNGRKPRIQIAYRIAKVIGCDPAELNLV